jgi:hypothetical protein
LHHDLAADDARLIGAAFFCHWTLGLIHRRQLFANAAMAASRVASGTRSALRLGCSTRQALATETVAECIRGGGVGETESNIQLLGLAAPSAAERDALFTVERVKF